MDVNYHGSQVYKFIFDSTSFLKTIIHHPGVYCMYGVDDKIIYVGKAKDLKKRLSSYFCRNLLSQKIRFLVTKIKKVEITITNSEEETLLLEQNFIKLYQPRYNVIIRDNKFYLFIFLSNEIHPRLTMHRGIKFTKGEYFCPFPNTYAVRETLILLQKFFPIRQCENSIYRNRSRPCLQYQIKRCLGPFVTGLVTEVEYAKQVEYVHLLLTGRNDLVLTKLIAQMEEPSQALAFKKATRIRDFVQVVRRVVNRQCISNIGNNIDVISIAFYSGIACAHVLFIRKGKVLGSQCYFPKIPSSTRLDEIVETFICQFYLQRSQICTLPSEILLDFNFKDKTVLIDFLSKLKGRSIKVQTKPRGDRARYLKLAHTNVENVLATKLLQKSIIDRRLAALAQVLKLPKVNRIKCFDIIHTAGQKVLGSSVVFDTSGTFRSEYHRYNITGIVPGDDYAAIKTVFQRRYGKVIEENKIPDVILINSGKGQLSKAKQVFNKFGVNWNKKHPVFLAIAKGTCRNIESDTLFFKSEGKGFNLPPDSPALYIIQYIRDESYKYALSIHRKKRNRVKNNNILERIEGVGIKRRQILLQYMGGLRGLLNASLEEISKVPGILQDLQKNLLLNERLIPL